MKNKLIGVNSPYYVELDLISGTSKVIDMSDELSNKNILAIKPLNNNPCTQNHIYLTAVKKNRNEDFEDFSYDALVVLNRDTHKIDWMHSFEEASLGINIPKLGDEKLYQLDNNNVLHIFEKVIG